MVGLKIKYKSQCYSWMTTPLNLSCSSRTNIIKLVGNTSAKQVLLVIYSNESNSMNFNGFFFLNVIKIKKKTTEITNIGSRLNIVGTDNRSCACWLIIDNKMINNKRIKYNQLTNVYPLPTNCVKVREFTGERNSLYCWIIFTHFFPGVKENKNNSGYGTIQGDFFIKQHSLFPKLHGVEWYGVTPQNDSLKIHQTKYYHLICTVQFNTNRNELYYARRIHKISSQSVPRDTDFKFLMNYEYIA
ncbi:hypothetical protein AGLY_014552 [Aphis glycines]|uniref:Uncharacterized protein n=1 Tax=Aphis glycines TaxID=307491 RepID=A0A6G0T3Z7_APHGL|nr:hypothetical protein AGLY_014552 [Aphis glycines]